MQLGLDRPDRPAAPAAAAVAVAATTGAMGAGTAVRAESAVEFSVVSSRPASDDGGVAAASSRSSVGAPRAALAAADPAVPADSRRYLNCDLERCFEAGQLQLGDEMLDAGELFEEIHADRSLFGTIGGPEALHMSPSDLLTKGPLTVVGVSDCAWRPWS